MADDGGELVTRCEDERSQSCVAGAFSVAILPSKNFDSDTLQFVVFACLSLEYGSTFLLSCTINSHGKLKWDMTRLELLQTLSASFPFLSQRQHTFFPRRVDLELFVVVPRVTLSNSKSQFPRLSHPLSETRRSERLTQSSRRYALYDAYQISQWHDWIGTSWPKRLCIDG